MPPRKKKLTAPAAATPAAADSSALVVVAATPAVATPKPKAKRAPRKPKAPAVVAVVAAPAAPSVVPVVVAEVAEEVWDPNADPNVVRVAAVDVSRSTGWCVAEYNKVTMVTRLLRYGLIVTDNLKDETEGQYVSSFYRKCGVLLHRFKPDVCHIENFFVNRSCSQGIACNYLLRGALYHQCWNHGIPYTLFSSFDWKATILHKVRLTKEDRKMLSNPKKAVIVAALKNRWGILFPEKIPSPKTKGLVNFKDDVSDATGQALHGIITSYRPTNLTVVDETGHRVEYIK